MPGVHIVFAGQTGADDFPLVNPVQSNPNDIFVARLSADGGTLQFSTYFGGEDLDWLQGMVLDGEDMVYLTGSTRSASFPTTTGAFQENFAGGINACGAPPYEPLRNCEDGFVAKLGTNDEGVVFATYLGGSSVDECRDIAVDEDGCAHVVGYTSSADFPGLNEPAGAIIVSKLCAEGANLLYTLAIQSGSPGGHGITIDGPGDVYFGGSINVPADIYHAKITLPTSSVPPTKDLSEYSVLHLQSSTPNPFAHSTQLRYALSGDLTSPVQLTVCDVSGRVVHTLSNAGQTAGTHVASWDGTNQAGERVPAGVYFYQLRWNGESQSKRVLLVR